MRTSKIIADLVQRFETHRDAYRSQGYNEAQLRREFIDPFFEALGWDVTNRAGYSEAYKDVIHEDALKVGGATKAPDCCFRIGGVRKFFVEVKKPAVNVKEEVGPAYQLRRYAWSAKLPLSLLTDFEEFAVYDCRFPPKPNDKPSTGRLLYCTYQDYLTRWEEIAAVFGKEAVLKGSFDKYAVSGKGKRGTSQVDAEFLTEIEQWREALARNLALRNPDLPVRDLNFAVQRTIDRIIFLRMCEDRGIEPYGQLQALLNGENVYERLRYLYVLADDRYNSGPFHFKPEKGRAEPPDTLTPTLFIDDKVLKEILRRLYYPESPYEFSVLSADILGNVYEQFLGKVIRLTAGHRAVIEEKPEVKKAGGVYYTPAYIVEYIVKQTVGKLCEGKTPKQIARLRILDPACGSGSFLIGAYACLLNHHRDWYVKDGPGKHTKEIYQGPGGQWLLATQEKKRILLNNIYGVDIDSQAVEVTKLSLLLKVLEGESQDTLRRQLRMWRERALPDLGSNIKCGNSLIGPDYYQGRQVALFDDEEIRRVNPFDWHAEFPHILPSRTRKSTPSPSMGEGQGGGGFDAVIGNPPYVRIQGFPGDQIEYFTKRYSSATGNCDLYVSFVERGYELLNSQGRFGFILPNKFFKTDYGFGLRKLLSVAKVIASIVNFGSDQVFDATTYTCLLFLAKPGSSSPSVSI
ncbi:MAG: N-6 DNA methylase [Nitrospirae bacterium]|nr:N-6 DNA methylase [Nitrospirota bacterium]